MNEPKCEVCGQAPAESFSWFQDDDSWKFCCMCTSETETYYLKLRDYFRSEHSQAEFIYHLKEKNWFKPDDFAAMLIRYHIERSKQNR